MNPLPSISISLDYLIELTDDGTQPTQPAPEIIVMPPVPPGPDTLAPPTSTPTQPQLDRPI